jgi:hypothetical protein
MDKAVAFRIEMNEKQPLKAKSGRQLPPCTIFSF